MKARLMGWMKSMEAKRLLALAVGPGLVALGLDAAVEHLAGRAGLVVPPQWVPVIFAPVACVALMACAAPRFSARVFALGARVVGAAAVVVGLAGSFFHVRGLLRLLEGAELSWVNLEAALAVAPPLFAPAAFAGVGAVVYLLGSSKWTLKFGVPEGGGTVVVLPRRAEGPGRKAA